LITTSPEMPGTNSGAATFHEIQRLAALLRDACVCESAGCRKFLGETAAKLAALAGALPRHRAAFRFDDDTDEHDPTGEWTDEDGDTWTLDGWLYPATGEGPVPLMQLTRSGDEVVHGTLAYLPALINEVGATRKAATGE